jgi:hypothetical protein
MKPIAILSCALMFLCVNAIPNIAPSLVVKDCGNGIYCAPTQTCMSNATGAGIIYACSPLSRAVRCMDARFSCPSSYTCADNSQCVSNIVDAKARPVIDSVVNIDAFRVAESRDFGLGIRPTSLSICGPITRNFRLPNFCTCRDGGGSELACVIGLQTYITIGASMWFRPCATPANFGYRAWASLFGISKSIGDTWSASFSLTRPIPGASFEIGRSNAGARVELTGEVSRFILSTQVAIGVCATLGAGPFTLQMCNPTMLPWLPVTILNGPRFDFSRFC